MEIFSFLPSALFRPSPINNFEGDSFAGILPILGLGRPTRTLLGIILIQTWGSVDVVHVKWSNCLAGDYNRRKGKENYPTYFYILSSNGS